MRGLVLSGGSGTRLRPLTYTSAKQLIPVANKPVLFYGLEALAEAGIKEVVIIVGDTADEVKAAVGDGGRWGLTVEYVHQAQPLGLAHCVKIARPLLEGEPFLMYLGDNLLKSGVASFVEQFEKQRPEAMILLARVERPERFGVVELDQAGRVVRLVEKPKVPPSDLALVGVYLFDQAVFEAVEAITPSNRGELEITDALQWLVEQGYEVKPHLVEGWWKDTGKPEDLLAANRLVLEALTTDIKGTVENSSLAGPIQIATGAVVRDSMLRGPLIIGENSRVERAFIGPFTTLGCNVVVEDAEIEHSILLDGARISTQDAVRFDSCLLGRDAVICNASSRPSAYKLVVGDQSRVELP